MAVPLAARSTSVFFTTRYLAPALRTDLRSSKSCATVSLRKLPTIAVFTLFSSALSFSTCSIFFAFETAILSDSSASDLLLATSHCSLLLGFCRRFQRRSVNRNSRPHAGRKRGPLDVLALGRCRLGLDDAADYRAGAFHQLVGG